MSHVKLVYDYEGFEFSVSPVNPDTYSMLCLLFDAWVGCAEDVGKSLVNPVVSYKLFNGEKVNLENDDDLLKMFALFESHKVIRLKIEESEVPSQLALSGRKLYEQKMEEFVNQNKEVEKNYPQKEYLNPQLHYSNPPLNYSSPHSCYSNLNEKSYRPSLYNSNPLSTGDDGGYNSVSTDDEWNPNDELEVNLSSSEDELSFDECESNEGDGEDILFLEDNDDNEVWVDGDVSYDLENELDNDKTPKYLKNGTWFSSGQDGSISLQVGQLFENKKIFLSYQREFAIQKGFAIKQERSTRQKYWATCKSNKVKTENSTKDEKMELSKSDCKHCPWRVYASKLQDALTWQIKTLNPHHLCNRLDKNPVVRASWTAKVLVDDFRANPDMKVKNMKNLLIQRHGVRVGKDKLYRARNRLLDMVEGSHKESYASLPSYIQLIMDREKDAICDIKWMNKNPSKVSKNEMKKAPNIVCNPLFTKLFISFEAMRYEFINGCRPFIGVDGVFLKGRYGGVLLVACALDGNNGIFPIAFALVEKENKNCWSFFFYYLKRLADEEQRKKWVIMSDRQKGVEPALLEQLPEVGRRICARHLYANFKEDWPGDLMKNLFWAASKAQNESDLRISMEEIKKNSLGAYNYLKGVPLEYWARHKFNQRLKVPDVTNNFVESFNGKLGELRSKPVLTMFEGIRRRYMKKMQKRRKATDKWTSKICPKVKELCDVFWHDGFFCNVISAGNFLYEVIDNSTYFIVNLESFTCDCQAWQNTGIPCKHVAAAVRYYKGEIENYVHPYFSKDSYMKTYEGVIHPIPDQSMWEDNSQPLLDPPEMSRKSGRPRKERKGEPNEPRKMKRSTVVHCSKCGGMGHNKRGCMGGEVKKRKKSGQHIVKDDEVVSNQTKPNPKKRARKEGTKGS